MTEQQYIDQIQELFGEIETLKSNNEDLKYFFNLLLADYAKVCSNEGMANRQDLTDYWLERIKYL